MDKKNKTGEIIKRLRILYAGTPQTALHFTTPVELLIATMLSAQTTDVLVNKVTDKLFKKYPNAEAFANTPPEKLAKDIASVNFFNNKAKHITATAKIIIEKYQGAVPRTMDELVSLPGVARKTANIVLSGAFGVNAGIAVDTHVKRLAFRLGLTKQTDPVKIEKDLLAVTPQKEWSDLSHLLIFHGRAVCNAKKPNHAGCILFDICPSKNI